jgi:hypothetical protein
MRANVVTAIAIYGICAAICSTSPVPARAQNLYQHVDEKGAVTYTDVPLNPEEKRLAISNTTRNGDGGGGRTKANKNKTAQEEKQQPNGKGEKRVRQKNSSENPKNGSPN